MARAPGVPTQEGWHAECGARINQSPVAAVRDRATEAEYCDIWGYVRMEGLPGGATAGLRTYSRQVRGIKDPSDPFRPNSTLATVEAPGGGRIAMRWRFRLGVGDERRTVAVKTVPRPPDLPWEFSAQSLTADKVNINTDELRIVSIWQWAERDYMKHGRRKTRQCGEAPQVDGCRSTVSQKGVIMRHPRIALLGFCGKSQSKGKRAVPNKGKGRAGLYSVARAGLFGVGRTGHW
ncbi:hypothetical protein BC826DRAFT_972937 [Russula brevipes]|nr:hypothetical protein BC826DRAFT_972937 [Russula brevipes]